MKKILTFFIVALLGALHLSAQIEVGTNNNVAIGIGSDVNSKLSVNHIGNASYSGYVYNPSTSTGGGIYAGRANPSLNSWGYGVAGGLTIGDGYSVGVVGTARSSTPLTIGRAFGVIGYSGNAKSGYNYSIYGELNGTNNGTAVFGTVNGLKMINGRYAGYFYGNTKVEGILYVYEQSITSDENSKKDIKKMDKNPMEKLKKVDAVKFKYKSPIEMGYYETESVDTLSIEAKRIIEEESEREHIGLIAQELQAVYPELVTTDPSGMLGINYMGLIPVLIEALKEQQLAIEILVSEVDKLKKERDKNYIPE